MNHFLLDLLPVLLFFIVFKYQGIYAATWVGIIATIVQASFYRLWQKRWDKMQVVTMIIFIIFGGMTLYLHDPIFVKWKPTIIFWVFAVALLASHFIGSKPMMQRFLETALDKSTAKSTTKHPTAAKLMLPPQLGKNLNIAWIIFFLVLGTVNLYVAYSFDDQVWVNFKLYGLSGATLVFSILQTLFLARHIKV